MTGRRRLSLQVRLVIVLLVISLVPLAVSAVLIDQIAEVAQSFASNHAARLRAPLERAGSGFRAQIDAKLELFNETAARIAAEIDEGQPGTDELRGYLRSAPDLLALAIDGPEPARVERPQPGREGLARFRRREVAKSLPGGRNLTLTFAADSTILEDLEATADAIKLSQQVMTVRDSLPRSYVLVFLVLVGGVVVLVTIFGIVVARRLTRRIETLLAATREVAGGDLGVRVDLAGRDELAELGGAFNSMVEDLASDRRQILYLQRISAWQDVARRLAHEIKNPLTPIKLAMQQVVSSYEGDDERFKRLLADADEIVGEEIAGLRRLVDAFSALGRLPRVDARALDLAVVVEDLGKDPVFAGKLVVEAPEEPVTVAGDRLLLRRLVANLVENGIQAGEDHGGVVVVGWSADRNTGTATLWVEDQGPGISAQDAETIFEPYVTSKETGTGLGLAIAKKIALEHRGSLSLAAPADDRGARFELVLPLAD
jgi:nitrogen fixation/metabolism regulation signal transduction histidine kinase